MRILYGIILAAIVTAAFCGEAAEPVRIDIGRQLFVDDFLVEMSTNVVRHWNKPVKIDEPFVWPGSGAAPKISDGATADDPVNLTCATDGGLWWDPTRQKFRLW